MKKEKNIKLLSIIFIVALFLSYHIYNYCVDELNKEKVEEYIVTYDDFDNYQENTVTKINYIEEQDNYLGILLIPKLNFKKGFYSIDSKKNNVNQNIAVLNESEMPDVSGSSLIIAAHNGSSYLAYFKDLDKLKINDEVDILYKNKRYQYTIFDIYELEKNGKISFTKNVNENYLVLTTCSKNKNKQLVVISKLVNKEFFNEKRN